MRRFALGAAILLVLCPHILEGGAVVDPVDVVYAEQPGAKGVYLPTTGEITELTPRYLILETTEHKRVLYTPEVVGRIVLDPNFPKYDDKQKVTSRYWNRDKSLLVDVFLSNSLVDKYFPFLSKLPGAAGTFVAVLILFGVLLYVTYRLYEILVVAARLTALNRMKLNLEIKKLHYDIEDIKKQLGLTGDLAFEQAQERTIAPGHFLTGLELPRVNVADFLKHKILRMLTQTERQHQAELWRKKWNEYREKSPRRPAAIYYSRRILNLGGTILMVILSIGFFVDIFLPFIQPEDFGSSAGSSLLFFTLFVISLGVVLRLNIVRRIMSETYKQINQ